MTALIATFVDILYERHTIVIIIYASMTLNYPSVCTLVYRYLLLLHLMFMLLSITCWYTYAQVP